MTSPKIPSGAKMLPYRRQGEIDYASLEFDPNEKELPPDHMEQSREIREITGLLAARYTDFDTRPDVFLDDGTFICYDPGNLNVRIAPDVYLIFGVTAKQYGPASYTCRGRRARRRTLPWKWHRRAPRPGMSVARPRFTQGSACGSIGALTPPAGGITGSRYGVANWSKEAIENCRKPANPTAS